MGIWNPLNDEALSAQIESQKKHAWCLEQDIPWEKGVDLNRFLLPLDQDAIAFPGANAEQRLALSQLMGLIINATIGEMEKVIHKLREVAFENILREYPVNPEMWELGDLFFKEEAKHSAAFARYVDVFADTMGIDRDQLDRLLPKAFGSLFLKKIMENARSGGFAFWWVVASVEEVSIEIYRPLQQYRDEIDPLYHMIHLRHLEEEARHRNYAFLMLDLLTRQPPSLKLWMRKKTDLILAQGLSAAWVLSELSKVHEAKALRHEHPFFATIHSALPLMKKVSFPDLFRRLFVSAPFISLVLNQRYHRHTRKTAQDFGILSFPYPEPRMSEVMLETNKRRSDAA